MAEISVIIPVYNVEQYLRQCLDSVCCQSFEDIEIICVNDGSTDNSADILDECSRNDSRIKVINQENSGLGAARNKGLSQASGKYVYFLDSDDYIAPKTLEILHENMETTDSDVVLFKFRKFDDDNNVHRRGIEFRIDKVFGNIDYSNFTFTYDDAKRHVMNSAFSACLKMHRKEFLDSFDDFYFSEGQNFEDVFFHVKVMLRASRISFVNKALYYYRSNENSILNSTANGFDIFKSIDDVESFLKNNGYYESLENEFIFFKIAQILIYIISTKSEDYFARAKEEFENLKIKDTSTVKKYALDGYELVLNSNSLNDYVVSYYGMEISRLKKDNKKLSRENRRLKRINDGLLSSNSWKLTKGFRFLKKL